MILAKLSTALTVAFGPVLDSTGAEYTGAAVGDVKISKNNGTPAALNGSATLTHKEVGIYELVLTTSDISAVGHATITLSKTTYVAPPIRINILPAAIYDSVIAGTATANGVVLASAAYALGIDSAGKVATPDTQKVDLNTIKTQTVTAAAGVTVPSSIASPTNITAATGVVLSGVTHTGAVIPTVTTLTNLPAITTDWLTGTGVAASAVTKVQAGLATPTNITAASGVTLSSAGVQAIWDALTSALTTVGSIGKKLADWVIGTAQTGDSYALIGTAGAGLTAIGDTRLANLDATVSSRSTLTQTQVSGGAYSLASASFVCGDTRLANLNATVSSRLAGTSYTAPDPTAIANAVWLYSSDLVTLDEAYSTSIAKTVIDSGGSSAAVIADAVWDEVQSGHTTAGTFGKYLDTTISSRATSVGAGSGARTVTITVNDGTTALQNAIVRMTEGVNTYTATTNVSGVATFNLDDATYTVSISKAGYSFSGTTLAVSGTTTQTYSMSAITITPPADPALTAAYLTTYDAQGGIAGSTVISFKLEDGSGTTGYSYSTTTFTGTSNASTGLLTINLIKSTSYSARRGTGEWVDFTTGTGSTYALPEILGTA